AWTQILGVFSSKGNIKADMLSKLLLEAILLAEQAGLFVDFVSCDGATWNRSAYEGVLMGRSDCTTAVPPVTKMNAAPPLVLWKNIRCTHTEPC
ncbi:hypothetical protein HPB47_011044, partial [Ixodes persulcatus]